MPRYELLNNDRHRDLRVATGHSARYGDALMSALTFPPEFRRIQKHYPILFRKDAETGKFLPLALFGFTEGENLFLDDDGWDASYVPVMIRRQPFLIGFQASGSGGEREPVVSIDVENPRVGAEGEPLFLPHGGRAPLLERAMGMLEAIHRGHSLGSDFVDALLAHSLLEPVTLEITLDDRSSNQLLGFYTINEETLRKLPAEAVQGLHARGLLEAVYMVLASLENVGELVRRKNRRVAGAAHGG
jgi:SapC